MSSICLFTVSNLMFKIYRVKAVMAAIVIGAFLTQTTVSADPAAMPVGVAEIDITPDYPIRLSGFGFRRTESEGVNQKIWTKALAIGDEKNGPAIVITVDNLGVPDDITQEVAKRLGLKIGLKRERLSISATHTHTAPMLRNVCPTLFGTEIPKDHQAHIDRYTGEFIDYLEKVALAAFKEMKPAHLFWGQGTVKFAINRRTKDGPVDHDLPLLLVKDLEGKVRGVYFNYACHCVTLSDNKISGDWAGYAQKRVQEMFPGSISLASIGCGADANPSSGVTGSNLQAADDQGKQIADEIKRLAQGSLTPINSGPDIRYTRIDLPFAPARTRAEWEERSKRNDAVGYHARVNLERLDRGEKIPEGINYAIQTWVFGDQLAIVFLPGETVIDYALRLKKEFDKSRLWINGYSNDSRCYIPSERILKEGGYEGGEAQIYYDAPQFFATGVEKRVIDAVHAQIPASFKAAPGTEGSKPISAAEALKTFKVAQGLKVELVASEPLIQTPVAIDWGADGRLWVCEMNDYPSGVDQNWKPGGQVKILEDLDGDGHYEKATLFASGLPFPTGVTAWGKGVYISAAPDIIYAQDTNGDGKADKIEKLFAGFYTDNFQARVNSLNLGLDNWIYGANGLLGGSIKPVRNSVFPSDGKAVDIRNHDFRFHPVTGEFQTVSGLTQQGRVRDDWGNWFGCDNSNLLFHFPVKERYILRNPYVPGPGAVRNLTARPDGNRLFPTSRLQERFNDPGHANRVTSACGLGIYRDSLLGDEFAGNAFICEPVHNLVHREVIESHDSLTSRRAAEEQQSEFLSSTDNWFRPVQARPGPDGALYIVDMYRFLIEHPRWIPAARLAQIDIRAGADKGRIYRVVKEGQALRPIRDLTQLNAAALAEAINVPNGIERDRVQVELLARNDQAAVPALKKVAETAQFAEVRVQALAALDGLSQADPAVVEARLKDADAGVRQHAIRISEKFLRAPNENKKMLGAILSLTNDSVMAVIRQLAFSLGESNDPRAGQALAGLAVKWINHAEIRTAILSSAISHGDVILTAITVFRENFTTHQGWVSPLIATLVNSKDPNAIARAVELVLPAPNVEASADSLGALAALLAAIDQRNADGDQLFAAGSENRKRLDRAISTALKLAGDDRAQSKDQLAALSILGRGNSEAEISLLSAKARSGSEEQRLAALNSLKRQRNPEVARALLKDWHQASPSARKELTSLLLDREEWTLALLQAVKEGQVGPHEISLADRQRLAEIKIDAVRKLAAEALPAQPTTGREEIVAQYQGAVSPQGNVSLGAAIFEKNCSVCHALNGIGHQVGPDLAPLRFKDAEYWVKNILDPNAVVEPRFVNYQLELNDGRSVSGIIRGETANSLTVVNGSGASETISRSQIKDIRASALSLMPEGVEQGITVPEMADLVAFLKSGDSRKIVPGNEPAPVIAGANGTLMLSAEKAEIYGKQITFEEPFSNIGMWHDADDHLIWTVQIPTSGKYDVYLDYASASNAAGNRFGLVADTQTLTGSIPATGADWSEYKQIRAGQIELTSGPQKVILRPEGQINGALIDLRTIVLSPPGRQPNWLKKPPADPEVLRDPPSVARFILDGKQSDAARQTAVNSNPQFAGALIKEMTRGLNAGTPEEYVRIPWIWRVAIACGKRNDAGQIEAVIEASLPAENQPLHDWQAVVIGGGMINGLSQRDLWPAERIAEILAGKPALEKRWQRALELSAAMTDNEKIAAGTRYDALRMIAMEPWNKRGAQLVRYLSHPNGELQMGAVSGLVDVNDPKATEALINALPKLEKGNRDLALAGLTRTSERKEALKKALQSGKVAENLVGEELRKSLN